jgi:RND family efflux transporter MFP subunit
VEVADPQFTDIVLAVSATEAAHVTPGARVALGSGAAHADDSLGTGVVSSVAAAIDSATRTVAVRVRVLQPIRPLRIGESVSGRIALAARAKAVVVPAAAVVPDGDAFRIYVIDSANVAHARVITVGARRNDRVEITTGVAVGERIVTDGAYQVDEGVHVAVRR